nr:M28 family peptidase [Hufsiella ginkgonis]
MLFSANALFAQDSLFARGIVDTLTSRYFWGRGYTNDGMGKAARFIGAQFLAFGLKPVNGKSYLQEFGYDVNTFPGRMEVTVNGAVLEPGRDFIVSPESRGIKATGTLVRKDSLNFSDPANRILVTLEDKLTWSVAQEAADYTVIKIDKKSIQGPPVTVSVNIGNEVVRNFRAANIAAVVRGTAVPDSFIVFTGHYDHLGGMGAKTWFPGANDNASGISMLLSLAKFYAAHPQRYSVLFICFAGEEAGILGSKHFTEKPLVPLNNIRFLVNMDITGTGEEGITVVNATVYPEEFNLIRQLNGQGRYLPKVVSRGKAANSDHYFFTEKGVPAFFIYTMGGIKAYHDVFDISKTLPLNKYNDLFRLLTQFASLLQK